MTDEAMTYQSLSSQLRSMSSSNNKHCWVCFASEDDDFAAQWVSPCKCKGTAKWVHKACLQRWIDEKQQGNSTVEVACPQCNSIYVIIYPKSGLFVRVLDVIDRIICKSCPFLAGGILVGSVYWTAVTYGAVTIMQVLGHKEGLNVMEKADPLIMLIGLPAIPVMLMLGRLIRWEDAVLKFWRKHSTKLPLINMIFPNSSSQYLPRTPAVAYSSNSDPVSFTRTICGGLILPTIATIVGKLLFQRVNSNFQRSIIGGMAYICLKGILKIYYKQQQFLRQAHRQIKNYEPPAQSAAAAGASMTTASIQHHHHIQPTSSSSFLHAASSHNPQQLSSSTSSTASQSAPSFLTNSSTAFNHSNIFVNSQQPHQQNSSNPHSESSARSHDLMNNNEESTLNHYLLYETTSGSRASTSSSSHLDTETNSSDAQTSSSHHNEHF